MHDRIAITKKLLNDMSSSNGKDHIRIKNANNMMLRLNPQIMVYHTPVS